MYIKNFVRHLDQALTRCIAIILMVAMLIPVELASVIDLSTDDSANKSYGSQIIVLGGSGEAGGNVANVNSLDKGLSGTNLHFCITLVDGTPGGKFYITDTNTKEAILNDVAYGYEQPENSTFILDSSYTSTKPGNTYAVAWYNGAEMQASQAVATAINLSTNISKPGLQYYSQIYNALKADKNAFESTGWETLLNQSKNVDSVWQYVLGSSGKTKQVGTRISALWNPEGLNYANIGDDEDKSIRAEAYFLDMLYSLYWISPGPESGSSVRTHIKERIKRIVDGSFSDKSFAVGIYPTVIWTNGTNPRFVTRTWDAIQYYTNLSSTHMLGTPSYREALKSKTAAFHGYDQIETAIRDDRTDYPNKSRLSDIAGSATNMYTWGFSAIFHKLLKTKNGISWVTTGTSANNRLHEYIWLNPDVASDSGENRNLLYGELLVLYDNKITPNSSIGKLIAEPDDKVVQVTKDTRYLGENVDISLYPDITTPDRIKEWNDIFKLCQSDPSATFTVTAKLSRTSNMAEYNGLTPTYTLAWPNGTPQTLTAAQLKTIINSNSLLLPTTQDLTNTYPITPPEEGETRIEFTYVCDLKIKTKISGTEYEFKPKAATDVTDKASFIIPSAPAELYATYISTPEAYAELKNYGVGSNQSGTLHEDYEVMSGVPTTRQLYYSAGGSEFIIDISFEYSKAEKAVRSYTAFYSGVKCEYYEKDSIKNGNTINMPTDSQMTTPSAYVLRSIAKAKDKTSGKGTWIDNDIQCRSEQGFDGKIVYEIKGDAECGADSGQETWHDCNICGSGRIEDNHTYIDTAPYQDAMAAMNEMAATLRNTIVHWRSASDKVDREIKWNVSISSQTDFGDHTSRGNDGSAGCGDGHSTCGGCTCGSDNHPCCRAGASHSSGSKCSASHQWTITMTCTIPDHCICGPCCSHHLPDIYDTWSQDFVYDSMKIVDVHVWRIDQAAASGLAEVIGPAVDENVEYTAGINSLTKGPYNNPNNLADGVVGAYIKTNFPNVFYNIAMKNSNDLRLNTTGQTKDITYRTDDGIGKATESSLVGRVRYNVNGNWFDADMHDEVFYDLGERTNKCDGMATGYPAEVKKPSSYGHEIYQSDNGESYNKDQSSWGKGFLYESYNSTYNAETQEWTVNEDSKQFKFTGSASTVGATGNSQVARADVISNRGRNASIYDLNNNDIWKPAATTEAKADSNNYWDGHVVTTNTTAVGGSGKIWPVGQTKYPRNIKDYLINNTDSIDKQTPEYKKILELRQHSMKAYMITDFLILQTTSGDQSALYFQKESSGSNDDGQPMTAETALKTLEIEGTEMYEGNSQSASSWAPDHINVGGYSGNYNRVQTSGTYTPNLGNSNDKYKGTGNYNTFTNTIFDKEGHNTVGVSGDPAKTINQPARPKQRLMLYSKPLNIIMDLDNQSYLNYGLQSEVFWTNHIHWTDKNSKAINSSENPKTPMSYSIEETTKDTTFDFSVATGKPSKVTEERVVWGQKNKDAEHKMHGYILDTKYSKQHNVELNNLIIQDPISVVNASLLSLPSSRDQRYANMIDLSALQALQDAFVTCPGTAADCEFAELNCKFTRSETMGTFRWNGSGLLAENSVNNTGVSLPSGYSQGGSKLTGTTGTRITVPLMDCLGINYQQALKLQIDTSINLSDLPDNTAGLVGERISQMLFSFATFGVYASPDGHIGFITKDRQYRESTTPLISKNTNYNIKVIMAFNSLDSCRLFVNGSEVAMNKSYIDKNNLAGGDVGSNFYIGAMEGVNYGLKGTMGPLTITRLAGTTYHDSDCYIITEVHPSGLNKHVHTVECLENGNSANSFEYYSNKFKTVGMTPSELRNLFGSDAYDQLFNLALEYKKINSFSGTFLSNNIKDKVNCNVTTYSNKLLVQIKGTSPSFVYYEPITTSQVNQLRLKVDNNTAGTKARVYYSDTNSFSSSTPYVETTMKANTANQYLNFFLSNKTPWTGSKSYFKIAIPANDDKNYGGNVQISEIVWIGKYPDSQTYNYSGSVSTYTAPISGYYLIEAWGAQGGGTSSYTGGRGGYAKGVVKLGTNEKIYAYVGGQGALASTQGTGGGYNGGGQAGAGGYGGGGMTFWSKSQNGAATTSVSKTGTASVTKPAMIFDGDVTLNATSYGYSNASCTWTTVKTFTAAKTGYITFTSTRYDQDPAGRILVNGSVVSTNDDNSSLSTLNGGTGGTNFGISYSVTAGATIQLQATTYSTNSGGKTCHIIAYYGDSSTSSLGKVTTGYTSTGNWSNSGVVLVAGGGGGASLSSTAKIAQTPSTTPAPTTYGAYAEGSFSASTPYCWYMPSSGCTYYRRYAYTATNSVPTASGHSSCGWVRASEYDYNGSGGDSGVGEVTNFSYTGRYQYKLLTPGTYKLEVWGAQGGDATLASNQNSIGGKGGYSSGILNIDSNVIVYIFVGGKGGNGTYVNGTAGVDGGIGGYNGGGVGGRSYPTTNSASWHYSSSGGGGGATHIASTAASLNTLSGNSNLIIVAGGGGGAQGGGSSTIHNGGYGGGGTAGQSGSSKYAYGGSQTSGGTASTPSSTNYANNRTNGSFGLGGNGAGNNSSNPTAVVATGGGGGGGYYGGSGGLGAWDGNGEATGGGGGSGYVNTSRLTSTQLLAGNTSIPAPSGGNETGHTGNGYARITKLSGGSGSSGGSGELAAGGNKTFNYTGNVQQITLAAGTYTLEVWGAQGGCATAGLGGYSKGEITLSTETTLYIGVGGKGIQPSGYNANSGGYNGGGCAGNDNRGGGGGGATHIATTNRGVLSNYSSYQSEVILVAGGGGGGSTQNGSGGSGGGSSGGNGDGYSNSTWGSYGGTQTSGGNDNINGNYGSTLASFGQGGGWTSSGSYGSQSGGGGGWYGGGAGVNGGGGSGYVNTSRLTNTSMSNGARSGSGMAKITCNTITPTDVTYTIPNQSGSYGGGSYGGNGTGTATGGTPSSGFKLGCGQSGEYEAKVGGAGGGWYGGKTGPGAGAGGSGYIGGVINYTTSKGSNYYAQQYSNERTGNGMARITFLEAAPTVFPTVNEIMEVVDMIPSSSPLIVCTKELNRHEHDSRCRTIQTLNCIEPHHSNNHYDGDPICYVPCMDPKKHQAGNESEAGDRNFTPGNLINLDWGFKIYFDNTGNFYQGGQLMYGLGSLTNTRGRGYTSSMDTADRAGILYSTSHVHNNNGPVANQGWTKTKQVRFPVNVIYKDTFYLAGEWITIGDKGVYHGEPGSPYSEAYWSQYGTENYYDIYGNTITGTVYNADSRNGAANHSHGQYVYEFYCVEANTEQGASMVEVRSFAINNDNNAVDQGQLNSFPTYTTNRARGGRNFEAKHSDYNYFLIDVSGRIGNLVLIDTGDYRFSNLFKSSTGTQATVDEPVYHTVQSGDVTPYDGGVKTSSNTITADDVGEGAQMNNVPMQKGTYRIYLTGSNLNNTNMSIRTTSAWEDSDKLPADGKGGMKVEKKETKQEVDGEEVTITTYEIEGPGITLEPGKYKITLDGENLDLPTWKVQNDSASIESYVTSRKIEPETVTFELNASNAISSLQIVGFATANSTIDITGATLEVLNTNTSKELVGTSYVSSVENSSNSKVVSIKVDEPTMLDIKVTSNGKTVTITSIGIQDMKSSGGTDYIVEGIVKEVDPGIQNNYLTHPVDMRGLSVTQNKGKIDTYNTLKWARTATAMANAGSGLPLDPTKNNIKILQNEPMLVGYDAFFSISTLGNYFRNEIGYLSIIPEYYALDTSAKEPKPIPVDAYILYNKAYYPVNIWGLNTRALGVSEDHATWGTSGSGYTLGTIYNFVVNMNWAEEKTRRMVTVAEDYITNYLKTALATTDERGVETYLHTPLSQPKVVGNSQAMQLDGYERTFIGGETTSSAYTYLKDPTTRSVGNTFQDSGQTVLFNLSPVSTTSSETSSSGSVIDRNGRENSTLYYDSKTNLYYNPYGRISAQNWWMRSQRWHCTLSLPSSTVFVRAGTEPTVDSIAEFQTKDYIILATADFQALGEIWNLRYKPGQQQVAVQNAAGGTKAIEIPTEIEMIINGTKYKHMIPSIITVYQTVSNPVNDIDIVSTH